MTKITKRFVESIAPDPDKILRHWDSELKGFGLVVLPSGRKTYCVIYRNADRQQKQIKIGVHGAITAELARESAKKILARVTQGEDPVEDKKAISNLETFDQLAGEYIAKHGLKKKSRSVIEDQRLIEVMLNPYFGGRKLQQIGKRDIESFHIQHKNTPYQANRAVALLSKMFSLAISWEWIEKNPVQGITRFQEQKRERWLDESEMQRLWVALDKHASHLTSYVFKLLLLTGARRGEVLNSTWDQFDLNKGVWTKPSHLTKQKRNEHLPLSSSAIDVLKDLKARHPSSSPFLFPSKVEGKPLQEVKRFWASVLKEAEIENCRIHDLRHTHASHLVSSGLSLSIVGKLLGHTQASTTQRYAHLADEPLREAAELFGSKVGKKKEQ